jgi:putative membrane protein
MPLLTTGTELKRFRRSLLPKISLAVLLVIPLVYGALYLWAFWNPTNHMNRLSVALVNKDQPAMSDNGLVRAGASLEQELLRRQNLGWHTVSAKQAETGIKDGKYYFMVTIPADFSARIAQAASTTASPARIDVTYNDTNSFLATTLGNEVMLQIRSTVSQSTSRQLTQALLTGTRQLSQGIRQAAGASQKLHAGAGTLNASTGTLSSGLGELAAGAVSLHSGDSKVSSGASELASSLAPATASSSTLAHGAKSVAAGSSQLASGANSASSGASTISSGTRALSSGIASLSSGITSAASGAGSLNTGLASLKSGSSSLESGLATLKSGTANLNASTSQLSSGASGVAQILAAIKTLDSQSNGTMTLAQVDAALSQYGGISGAAGDASSVAGGAEELASSSPTLTAGISSAYSGSEQLASGIGSAAGGATSLASGLKALEGGAGSAQSGAASLKSATASLAGGLHTLASGASSLKSGSGQVAAGTSSLATGVAAASSAAGQLASGSGQTSSGSAELANSAESAASGARELHAGTGKLAGKLGEFATTATHGAKSAPRFTAAQTRRVADVVATPVRLQARTLHYVSSWGAGFAPFFIALATFVGALITWLILHPLPTRPLGSNVSGLRHALMGFVPAALVAVGQVIVMLLVLRFGIGLRPLHWLAMGLFVLLVTLAFLALQQMLVVLLGSAPGRVVALVLLMLQLSSCGGTYPVQTSPGFFNAIHPFMPATYAVNALRPLIGGGVNSHFWVGLAVFVGLLLVSLAITAVSAGRQKVWTITRLHPELTV